MQMIFFLILQYMFLSQQPNLTNWPDFKFSVVLVGQFGIRMISEYLLIISDKADTVKPLN